MNHIIIHDGPMGKQFTACTQNVHVLTTANHSFPVHIQENYDTGIYLVERWPKCKRISSLFLSNTKTALQ